MGGRMRKAGGSLAGPKALASVESNEVKRGRLGVAEATAGCSFF